MSDKNLTVPKRSGISLLGEMGGEFPSTSQKFLHSSHQEKIVPPQYFPRQKIMSPTK